MENEALLTPAGEQEELFHLSLHPAAETTIVLIHGLLASHREWDNVTPHLTNYHLLVVDAPGHSNSSHLLPARIPDAADLVAALIRRRAHGGRAHVVGLSMGGFITLNLARRFPELVLSAWATGSAPFEGSQRFMAAHPSIPWYLMTAIDALPDAVYWLLTGNLGLLRHEDLRAETRRNRRWEVVHSVFSSILEVNLEQVRGIKEVRVLAIAGGRQDPVEPTRKMGLAWKDSGHPDSRAVVVKAAVHAWDLQLPVLFADGVLAWIEGRPLPEQFEPLV
ncbi:alpha/beta-hydrolase [Thozetella sp. PMI_491]|nr:alpha/beta-hydrolase [Thozetella sp. PMI_491]